MRHEWAHDITATLQRHVLTLSTCDIDEAGGHLQSIAAALAPPSCREEQHFLRSILFEFAYRAGMELHGAVHEERPFVCTFRESDLLEEFFSVVSRDVRDCYARWAERFAAALVLGHRVSPARRAAHLLRDPLARPNLEALARQVGVSGSRLHKDFTDEYGMSLRAYGERLRIAAAMKVLANEKIEAVAASLGYRSRKNFNRAFLQVTGMTPSKFRHAEPAERLRILDRVELALARATARQRRTRQARCAARSTGSSFPSP